MIESTSFLPFFLSTAFLTFWQTLFDLFIFQYISDRIRKADDFLQGGAFGRSTFMFQLLSLSVQVLTED